MFFIMNTLIFIRISFISEYLSSNLQFVPPSVGFQLNISLEGNDSVQVFVSLPQDYPSGGKYYLVSLD